MNVKHHPNCYKFWDAKIEGKGGNDKHRKQSRMRCSICIDNIEVAKKAMKGSMNDRLQIETKNSIVYNPDRHRMFYPVLIYHF